MQYAVCNGNVCDTTHAAIPACRRFGLPYEAERYEAAVQAACLDADFRLLPGGDMTELGGWRYTAAVH